MSHSTFRQPLPADARAADVERLPAGLGKADEYEYRGPRAGGQPCGPGDDMAHFMIAHLQNGEYDGKRILKPETARADARQPADRRSRPTERMELGFYETNINGREVIAHGGDTEAFHTDLHLFLEGRRRLLRLVQQRRQGRRGAAAAQRALFDDFADRYFPETAPSAGVRRQDARPRTPQKLQGSLFDVARLDVQLPRASPTCSGRSRSASTRTASPCVRAAKGLNGQPRNWVEIGPMLWRDADGHELLAAKVVDGKAPLQLRLACAHHRFRPRALVRSSCLAASAAVRAGSRSVADRVVLARRERACGASAELALPLEGRKVKSIVRAGSPRSRSWRVLALVAGRSRPCLGRPS